MAFTLKDPSLLQSVRNGLRILNLFRSKENNLGNGRNSERIRDSEKYSKTLIGCSLSGRLYRKKGIKISVRVIPSIFIRSY